MAEEVEQKLHASALTNSVLAANSPPMPQFRPSDGMLIDDFLHTFDHWASTMNLSAKQRLNWIVFAFPSTYHSSLLNVSKTLNWANFKQHLSALFPHHHNASTYAETCFTALSSPSAPMRPSEAFSSFLARFMDLWTRFELACQKCGDGTGPQATEYLKTTSFIRLLTKPIRDKVIAKRTDAGNTHDWSKILSFCHSALSTAESQNAANNFHASAPSAGPPPKMTLNPLNPLKASLHGAPTSQREVVTTKTSKVWLADDTPPRQPSSATTADIGALLQALQRQNTLLEKSWTSRSSASSTAAEPLRDALPDRPTSNLLSPAVSEAPASSTIVHLHAMAVRETTISQDDFLAAAEDTSLGMDPFCLWCSSTSHTTRHCSKVCARCAGPHVLEQCPSLSRSVFCSHCKRWGHVVKACLWRRLGDYTGSHRVGLSATHTSRPPPRPTFNRPSLRPVLSAPDLTAQATSAPSASSALPAAPPAAPLTADNVRDIVVASLAADRAERAASNARKAAERKAKKRDEELSTLLQDHQKWKKERSHPYRQGHGKSSRSGHSRRNNHGHNSWQGGHGHNFGNQHWSPPLPNPTYGHHPGPWNYVTQYSSTSGHSWRPPPRPGGH